MVATDPRLLEILKLAAWQQAVIGVQASRSIREALRLDDSPPPAVATENRFRPTVDFSVEPTGSEAQARRDLVQKTPMNRRVHGVWAGTQLLLTSAANVGKLLWPPAGDSSDHCRDLRQLLAVDESSAIADRWLRNGFEHFGERIIDWANSHAGDSFSDSAIVESSHILKPDVGDGVPIRAFMADTFAVYFMGREIELLPLETALEAIRERASPMAGLYLEE